MNAIIKDKDEDQFANGQSSRDLRVSSDARELQLMEAIDNIEDFLRFVERANKSEIIERFYARCRNQTSRHRPAP